MSNDLTANPLILDTANTSTVLTTLDLRVKGIRWVGATTAGHTAIIKDRTGRVVWHSVAAGANNVEGDDVNTPPQGWNWRGLIMHTLGSGTVYVELL